MTDKINAPAEVDTLEALSPRALWKATTKITLLSTENPKKKGTMAYDRFQGYFKLVGDCVVQDALDQGLRMDDIRHDSAHGFIHLGDGPVAGREMTEGDL